MLPQRYKRNHSPFAEMARPALLGVGGEPAFVLVMVKETLNRLLSFS